MGSFSPIPLLKQGQLEQVAQDHVWSSFEYLGRYSSLLHKLSGQPLPVFDYLCNIFFLKFRWNFICFNLSPLPLVLPVSTTEKSLIPLSLLFPSDICTHW